DGSALFEIPSGQLIAPLPAQRNQSILSMAFSSDGSRLAVADDDGVVRIRDAANGAVLRNFAGYRGAVRVVSFDATGSRLATRGTAKNRWSWGAAGRTRR